MLDVLLEEAAGVIGLMSTCYWVVPRNCEAAWITGPGLIQLAPSACEH